jgi:hypothetical protein
MNLLDRMRPLQLAMLAAGFFFSCESETGTFDFDLENNTSVKLIELELPSRSIFIDSLRTDNESRVVVGDYSDERFGNIEAEAYSEITYTEGRIIADTLKFDSLIINLTVDNYLSNDPELSGAYTISKLSQGLESSIVYLKDRQMETRAPLDTLNFSLIGDTEEQAQNLSIRADRWGRDLFTRITVDSVGQTLSAVIDEIALVPTEDNQTALSINLNSDSTEIILYSSYDTIPFETTFRFATNHFSYIDRSMTGAELSGIQNAERFDMSDDTQLVSAIFGIYNYVDLTPLKNYIVDNEDKSLLVNQAEINTPALASSSEEVSSFRYYFFDEQYGIRGERVFNSGFFTLILSNTGYLENSTTLLVSEFNEENRSYDQDITFFMENLVNYYEAEEEFIADGLVLTPNAFVGLQETQLTSPSSTSITLYITSID